MGTDPWFSRTPAGPQAAYRYKECNPQGLGGRPWGGRKAPHGHVVEYKHV